MPSNMSTKICDIVNNLSQLIDQQWYDEFWSKYGPGYKGGREAFKAEALEFCLAKHGHTYRKNYQHDSIFYFDPSLVIDWKWVNPIYIIQRVSIIILLIMILLIMVFFV